MLQPVSSWSALLIRAYVIGISVAIHPSHDDPEEIQTISQAIDRLHEPENLFLVCSTLAMNIDLYDRHAWVFSTGADIMADLVQIRPLDPAWGNCRQRLWALAQYENCFVRSEGEETDTEERRRIYAKPSRRWTCSTQIYLLGPQRV